MQCNCNATAMQLQCNCNATAMQLHWHIIWREMISFLRKGSEKKKKKKRLPEPAGQVRRLKMIWTKEIYDTIIHPTFLKSIRFCFIDVRWLLTAFDFQILKTTTCTLSYKTLKILSTFCSLVWKIRENLKILFSKIWPDGTDSCNIMCIWVKSPGEFKNLDLSKVNEHRTSSSLLESLKLSCIHTSEYENI